MTKRLTRFSPGALLAMGTMVFQLHADPTLFTPGQLAVMQLGDGGTNRCLPLGLITGITNYSASDLFGSRQNQIFIDQFDPAGANQTKPAIQIAIPTNGPSAMLINGNAGTEGNLTLAGDRSVLAFAAYQADILSVTTGQPTAPSNLSYDRGIGTVDAFGSYVNVYRGGGWYGIATGKTNPRGVATDGAGNFWGCGNGYGSLYFNASSAPDPIQFQNIALTSCSKVINDTLFASVKSSESVNLYPAGIYSFVDFFNNPDPHPSAASFLHLEIQADAAHNNCIGFDINPQKTVAYLADASVNGSGGIQKYARSGLTWKMAYNLAIPGYFGLTSGIMTNANSTNVLVGCFSVTVDWSGAYPVVYATTADSGVNSSNPYYGNRVIRIDDTNSITTGATIIAGTNILTTVARPPVVAGLQITNMVYKSVTFTPDLRPVITSNPSDRSAVLGDTVKFSVGASSKYPLTYQWLKNGVPQGGTTGADLTLNSVAATDDANLYRAIVSNTYGAVTSLVSRLTVSSSAISPTLAATRNMTNFVGDNVTITAQATGTDPISYQWYFDGTRLNDANEYSGTATSTLSIANAQSSDSGVYSVVAVNSTGTANSANGAVANLSVQYALPVMVQPPQSVLSFAGHDANFNTSGYGAGLTYQWWKGTLLTTNTIKATTTVKSIFTNSVLSATTTNTSSSSSSPGVFTYLENNLASGPALTLSNAGLADATGTQIANVFTTNNPALTSVTNGIFVTNTVVTTVTNISVSITTNNYFAVLSNPAGSLTSAPVSLTILAVPPHTFISYASAGQVYTQNFDTLPIPGLGSAEGANPLHITYVMTNLDGMLTNANPAAVANLAAELQYSVANPMDFGYPILPSGAIGGLGLSNSMGGWYGWAQNALVFAAGKGDQSQGAIADNGGNYYADGAPLTGITNRALGLVATTKTGPVAFGAAFINNTSKTLNSIDVSYTGELWRNNPNSQVLLFGYMIDPAGTNSTFQPGQWDSTNAIHYVSTMNVTFVASPSTTVNDGTQVENQLLGLASVGLPISDWPPNAALWLVWSGQTQGSAQDVAIDDFRFAATGPGGASVTLGVQLKGSTLTLSWPESATGYILQASSDLNQTKGWSTVNVVNGSHIVTMPIGAANQYFRLKQL